MANFEHLVRAFKTDQVALLECHSDDDTSLLAICTVTEMGSDMVEFQPFALLLEEPDFHKAKILARRQPNPDLN